MNSHSNINRLLRPFDAVSSFRGLTIADEAKILSALFIGYIALMVSKIFKPARVGIEKRFGASRIDFIAKLTNLKYIIKSFNGLKFVIRPEWSDYEITSPSFECEVKQVFKPKHGEVIIDIGAHIGIYTVRVAKVIGKDGFVIALEPDPENFRLLNLNINLNNLGNVLVLQKAVYKTDGIFMMHKSMGSAGHSLVRVPEKSIGKYEVYTITLDTLINNFNLNRVDWVKIDVEGGELYVLKGASDKTLQIIKNFIIEVWYENANEVFKLLRREGYKIKVLVKYVYGMYILAER